MYVKLFINAHNYMYVYIFAIGHQHRNGSTLTGVKTVEYFFVFFYYLVIIHLKKNLLPQSYISLSHLLTIKRYFF